MGVVLSLLSSEKTKQKKIPKKISHSPQYFKMMVLLLYIQNQDKQKMTKKNQIKFPEKKNSKSCYYLKQPPKIPQQKLKICHTPQFFLQVMNKILERKKNNQKKTKQAREKEIMFLFLTPRFRKKRLQLSCKIQGNTKSKLTRKTKILQKNPMKYTHKKVEVKKKKNLRKKKYY